MNEIEAQKTQLNYNIEVNKSCYIVFKSLKLNPNFTKTERVGLLSKNNQHYFIRYNFISNIGTVKLNQKNKLK